MDEHNWSTSLLLPTLIHIEERKRCVLIGGLVHPRNEAEGDLGHVMKNTKTWISSLSSQQRHDECQGQMPSKRRVVTNKYDIKNIGSWN